MTILLRMSFIFLCAIGTMIQKCRCSGFMWLPGAGRIFAREGENVDMVWTYGFETSLPNLKLDIILTFMGHRSSFERDVVNQAVPLTPAAIESLQIKDRHMSNRISCDYIYKVTHKLHCKVNNVMVSDTGDYRLHLTVRDSEIRAKVVNSTCLYVNYDYTLKTYPRDIRAFPKESVSWTFSFKSPEEIVPVFLINIKISYSNSTASENMFQLISQEISSNITRDIRIEVSDKVLPFYNRSRVVYQQGRLTIEIQELSREDSGSFQVVLILGSKEGTHRQSYLVDNVALFMIEDYSPIVNNTCNVTNCSTPPTSTKEARQIKGLTAGLTICGVALIVVTAYSIKSGKSEHQSSSSHPVGSVPAGSSSQPGGSVPAGSSSQPGGSVPAGSSIQPGGSVQGDNQVDKNDQDEITETTAFLKQGSSS